MVHRLIALFTDKSKLAKRIEVLERENSIIEEENFNLEENIENMRATIRQGTEQSWALQRRLEDKAIMLDTVKEESRKLAYHVQQLLENTHLTPAGELAYALASVEALTRLSPEKIIMLKKIERGEDECQS